ncbi:tRNA glutamyl-Q(34) synthetase GluQRS [Lentibacter sp. XHP0401]|uniref:tRNA glutamyl-Q(34) synthetase GluQRS n=1 Tax=Lentibacter sp. XHP0401 TaxID=2984334 RepID=UPI0021E8EEC5|nr:tRNA glutamyl-Q(34) synthetase GluQRS [Lentibacter sp. XHP0401]MCV2892296.1 tRNA glutamyl-Q(34) synthetase GluQRS [Lentibacter sp. XHP0401]
MIFATRFAPSPTGPLHLGHAYSAILAHDMAQAAQGRFLLRIEDIDSSRARPEWEAQIYDDLAWLGLTWEKPVLRQSARLPAYRAVLTRLWALGLIYPCTCSRRDIAEAASAPQEGVAPAFGPDGLIYPGTCRHVPNPASPLPNAVLRLNMARALAGLPDPLTFTETGAGPNGETGQITLPHAMLLSEVGDIILARAQMGASYHLSVVLDDDHQGITLVPRGQDLFTATYIHVVLQKLLGLSTPAYHHHRLIRDEAGKRLAKRDDARAISLYRDEGKTPSDIRAMVGL